jgi:hypothetical protein
LRGPRFEASLGKQFKRLHLQNNQRKIDWWRGSRVECLLCKHKVLSSNSRPTKKKKKKNKKRFDYFKKLEINIPGIILEDQVVYWPDFHLDQNLWLHSLISIL